MNLSDREFHANDVFKVAINILGIGSEFSVYFLLREQVIITIPSFLNYYGVPVTDLGIVSKSNFGVRVSKIQTRQLVNLFTKFLIYFSLHNH